MGSNVEQRYPTIVINGCEEDFLILDSLHFQEMLPVEVWNVVCSKVSKYGFGECLINSSPFFRDISAEKTSLLLFENAIKVVTDTIWSTKGLEGLPIKKLLKLRQSCTLWCKVIDKLIYENFQGPDDKLPNDVNKAIKSIANNEFDNKRTLLKFLKHFEKSHPSSKSGMIETRNPLICPHLSVNTYIENEDEEDYDDMDLDYLEAMSTLFKKYGHHLKSLEILFGRPGRGLNLVETQKMREWLLLTPNLNTLVIINETEYLDARIDAYRAQILDNPFPNLKFLQSLEMYRLPGVFTQLVIENSHISKLVQSQNENDDEHFIYPLFMPNLKYLQMDYVASLGNLKDCQVINWPKLETFKLHGWFTMDNLKCAHIFQMVQQNFANTLVHLVLEFPRILWIKEAVEEFCQYSITCRLDLPMIKEVDLTLPDGASLDFLLPMKDTLEVLRLDLLYLKDEKPDQVEQLKKSETIVKLLDFEENVLKSNIPTLFTSLKKIGIRILSNDKAPTPTKWYTKKDWAA